jgi:hypothetical protein
MQRPEVRKNQHFFFRKKSPQRLVLHTISLNRGIAKAVAEGGDCKQGVNSEAVTRRGLSRTMA